MRPDRRNEYEHSPQDEEYNGHSYWYWSRRPISDFRFGLHGYACNPGSFQVDRRQAAGIE